MNATAQASSALSSTGISTTIPRSRCGRERRDLERHVRAERRAADDRLVDAEVVEQRRRPPGRRSPCRSATCPAAGPTGRGRAGRASRRGCRARPARAPAARACAGSAAARAAAPSRASPRRRPCRPAGGPGSVNVPGSSRIVIGRHCRAPIVTRGAGSCARCARTTSPPPTSVMVAAFEDLERRLHEPPPPPRDPAGAYVRLRRILATDPGGCWVAEDGDGLAGASRSRSCARALGPLAAGRAARTPVRRASAARCWRARSRTATARARRRSSSPRADPRALRAYARAGFALHPSLSATGVPRGAVGCADVRPFEPGDHELAARVDRAVRGAPHGADLDALAAGGCELLALPERGYAAHRDGAVKTIAAFDDEAAARAAAHACSRGCRRPAAPRSTGSPARSSGRSTSRSRPGWSCGRGGAVAPARRRRPVPAVPSRRGLPVGSAVS